jgi:hypothetical protein
LPAVRSPEHRYGTRAALLAGHGCCVGFVAMPVALGRSLIVLGAWALAACESSIGLQTGASDSGARNADARDSVDVGSGGDLRVSGGGGGDGGVDAAALDGGGGIDGQAVSACSTTEAATSAGYDGGLVLLRTCCDRGTPGGAAGTGGSVAPATCPTTDMPPTDPFTLHVYHLVEADLHAKLERMVGRYACGTTPLYRGMFTARDNISTISSEADGMLDGAVIAALAIPSQPIFESCVTSSTTGRELLVIATNGQAAIRLAQAPNDATNTYATFVAHPGQNWNGNVGTCSVCATDFHTGTPSTIDVSQGTFAGYYCGDDPGPLTVAVQGHLTLADQPTIDDIMNINAASPDQQQPPFSFSQSGPDLVATVSDVAVEPISLSCSTGCEVTTTFHVEVYVESSNPRVLGLRNFRIDPPQTSCCGSYEECI